MNTRSSMKTNAVCSLALLLSGSVMAGDSVEDKIERARSAAPAAVSAEATVMDTDLPARHQARRSRTDVQR